MGATSKLTDRYSSYDLGEWCIRGGGLATTGIYEIRLLEEGSDSKYPSTTMRQTSSTPLG